MIFKLEQLLTDPELKCPKGEVQIQITDHSFKADTFTFYTKIRALIHKLKLNNITHTYHGNGLFTIHNL